MEQHIKKLIAAKFSGECNFCGKCCEVYESGKPCRHLIYEDKVNEKGEPYKRATCNSETLHAGYFGRPLGCVLYPLNEDGELFEECGFRRK